MGSKSKELRLVYLDYEFSRVKEPSVNLVSCTTYDEKNDITKKWWLHKSPKKQRQLAKYLKNNFDLIIGYSCVAEARSFLSLNLDPLYFNWIDLFLEYRMLTNHNDALQWGKQLVDGKPRTFRKPPNKWERTEDDGKGFKATHSLAEATYKLTGKIRDTREKNEMRDLIISDPKSFTKTQRHNILKYNASDVKFLPTIFKRIKEEYKKLCGKNGGKVDMVQYIEEAMWRGRYSAHTAIMEADGYPINVEATRNFSRQIPYIISECQRDINEQFPDIEPFKWKKRDNSFSWNQKATRDWLEDNIKTERWMKTKSSNRFPDGQLSLALEAWERVYPFKHDYPRKNFGAQIVRYLKLKQSLTGFGSKSGGKNFWDNVGSDGRVRPYMNHYGAQSSRSQPAATGFMFLKPAWVRALVQPAKGYFIGGVDFGQQEFFLAALESQDKNMIDAYLSGDPYMYGAKLAGVIPKHGKREDYEVVRDVFKNTYLGILFGMTKYGLAIKLTNDTGRNWTEDEAQEQIDMFEETFPDYVKWKEDQLASYEEGNLIRLPDGWICGPDNTNPRSVLNVPIQGRGAVIMRQSVDRAAAKHVKIIKTLHDALYTEDKVGNEKKVITLIDCMREGFKHYYKGTKLEDVAGHIKLDPKIWGDGYETDPRVKSETDRKGKIKHFLTVDGIKIPCSNIHIDARALSDFNRFSKYFQEPDIDLL